MTFRTLFSRATALTGVTILLGGILVPALHISASSSNQFLDTSFGTDGVVRVQYNSDRGASIRDIALQPDGKFVAAVQEYCLSLCSRGFAVTRHNSNGTLDHTFNGTGFTRTPVGNHLAEAKAIALQSDGKIVVAGNAFDSQGDERFGMVRYNTNGTVDTQFGTNGVVITDTSPFTERVQDLVIQPDGKILVVGFSREWTGNAFQTRWLVVRYDTDGLLDTSFATTGVYHPMNHVGETTSIALQSDGKIIVAGQKDFNLSVLRLHVDGTPDTSFGVNGYASVNLGSISLATDVLVQPDGNIVISGEYDKNVSSKMFVVRFTVAGQLDTSFGVAGAIQPNWGYLEIFVYRVALDGDNKILVTGVVQDQNNEWDIYLTRFNTDGTLDTTFYSIGRVSFEDPDYEEALAMVVTSNGKILIAGNDGTATTVQALLLRINPSMPSVSTTSSTTSTTPSQTSPIAQNAQVVSAPASVSYRAGNKGVTLRWGAVSGASSYVVTTTRGAQVCETATTSCVVKKLRNGRAYSYNVFSVNADGVRSENSTRVSVRPGFQVRTTTAKTKRSVSLSSIVTTPSKGRKTWTITSGACRINGARLVTPTRRGSCKLRLSTAKSGSYAAMSTTITVTVR